MSCISVDGETPRRLAEVDSVDRESDQGGTPVIHVAKAYARSTATGDGMCIRWVMTTSPGISASKLSRWVLKLRPKWVSHWKISCVWQLLLYGKQDGVGVKLTEIPTLQPNTALVR